MSAPMQRRARAADVRKSLRQRPRSSAAWTSRSRAGERHAIIGPNGAGKSTLFNLISGRFARQRGPHPAATARTSPACKPHRDQPQGPVAQLPDHQHLPPPVGVREPALRGALVARLPVLVLAPARRPAATRSERAEEVLERDRPRQPRATRPAGLLTYAEQRALEIGITIAGGADVILLDEPTAGMSRSETDDAVELIRRVTDGQDAGHGRARHGRGVRPRRPHLRCWSTARCIATGTPEEIRANPAVQEAYLGDVHRIASTRTAPMLEVRDLHAYYGKSHILHGVHLDVRRGRDRQPAGPQRRRPLDHDQGDHGPGRLHAARCSSTARRWSAARPTRSRTGAWATCPRTATSSRPSPCARTCCSGRRRTRATGALEHGGHVRALPAPEGARRQRRPACSRAASSRC